MDRHERVEARATAAPHQDFLVIEFLEVGVDR
jgi:hypothetical protein